MQEGILWADKRNEHGQETIESNDAIVTEIQSTTDNKNNKTIQ